LKNTKAHLKRSGYNVLFIAPWNELGAPVNPKDMTVYSN